MEKALPKRAEVPEELTWRLEDICADEAAWEQQLNKALELADEMAAMEGTLGSAPALLKFFDLYEQCMDCLYHVTGYAHMRHDEDTGDGQRQALNMRSRTAMHQIMEKLAFFEPELLDIPDADRERFFAEEPGLNKYAVTIREIVRRKPHMLDKEQEKLLASAHAMAEAPSNGFGMLMNADLKFDTVTKADGTQVTITNGRFVPLQMDADRALRREVFEKYYGRYKAFANTWAALYEGQVQKQLFYARARKYGSAFEAAVDANNVSPAVCDSLIDSVRRGLPAMHRYVSLRKRLLGVDELHMYDVYVPMVKDRDESISYEKAKELTLEALAPMGEEYVNIVKKAYAERWIDVAENEGKRSGAYSSGVYGVHPYMLLNYNGTLDDVFTLIHEMGHSMHTWYSSHAQSLLDSDYTIFVAEVASTTNEILLLEYLLGRASSKEEKAYLINHYLESFKGTLFRQTMFEEFERRSNEMAAEGKPLTADALSGLYLQLNRDYFGEDMVSDPLIAYEWCRIPHFYYNFYVYQYATSFAAAVDIAHRILKEGAPMVERYLKFLSGGCTQDPVSLLKIAGVDLSTPDPIDRALAVFDDAVRQMEELMA